jgi:hypothetical protein
MGIPQREWEDDLDGGSAIVGAFFAVIAVAVLTGFIAALVVTW